MPSYSFERSLVAGHQGELRFAMLHPELRLKRTDGRTVDFISELTGAKFEVKCESRTTQQTPNIAVEWSSSFSRPGAIHNALKHGADYIVFLFADGHEFVYPTRQLYWYVRKHKAYYRKFKANNITYASTGYLVPRSAIRFLEVKL